MHMSAVRRYQFDVVPRKVCCSKQGLQLRFPQRRQWSPPSSMLRFLPVACGLAFSLTEDRELLQSSSTITHTTFSISFDVAT